MRTAQTAMAASNSPVADVVEAARGIFSKRPPPHKITEKDVEGILTSLERITVAQVGLTKKAGEERCRTERLLRMSPQEQRKSRPPITYHHIYECRDFTVGIFCIPENCDIPIHNHPDMTVCSKVLYGKVHLEAYDKAPDLESSMQALEAPDTLYARKVRDEIISEGDGPVACFSEKANIHRFYAEESCAILDVLGPPYDSGEGREIAYYREIALGELGGLGKRLGNNVVVLQEVSPPNDFVVEGRPYTGEQVGED